MLTLSVLTAQEEPAYDAFLRDVEEALLYYSVSYKRFLQDLLGCEAQYWLAWESGRILGVLPLMWRNGEYGRVLNSLPFYGSNGGVLATSREAANALTQKYNEIASSPEIAAATWICNPLRPESPSPSYSLTDERIGQFTPLAWDKSDPKSSLSAAIDGSARRNIRKARSSGVTVRIADDQLDFIRKVHQDNMAEIGGRAKSADFFVKLPRFFRAGSDYRVYVAERDGRQISGLLLLYFNRTVEYFTPVTVSSEREYQPMALILERAMLDAWQEGYLRWNWGGTWLSQEGVWRFKRKWGAADYPYNYYVHLNSPSLLRRSREEILEAYPDFFVVPFGSLENAG